MKCPRCGIERVSTTTACAICGHSAAATAADHQPTTQPAQVRRSATVEKVIWEGHPSHLYYIGYWMWGVPLTLMFMMLLILQGPMKYPFLLGPFLIGYALLDQKNRVYTHTTRKVVSKSGIVSQRTSEVNLGDIRVLNMNQRVVERLLGLGSIQIGSAGVAGIEVEFRGIKNPVFVRDQIRESKDAVGV